MTKLFSLLYLFLCGLTINAQAIDEKESIDINKIAYVEISKRNLSTKTDSPIKRVTIEQYKDFVEKWNSSKSLGADKFVSKYVLYLVFKNGSKRQFTINRNKIQQSNWMTFDIGDDLYFEKIWKKLK